MTLYRIVKMKILLANKFYYRRGGDCVCTLNLEELLKTHGHDVAIFAMQYPDNLPSKWSKYFPSEVKFKPGTGMIEAFMRPFGTKEVKRKFNALLDDFQPDVVHLNNIHSQLSPVIAELAHRRGIRVVWTLHDYKLLCPRYDCRKNDKVMCHECFTDKRGVLRHKCMKNALFPSLLSYFEAVKWSRERLETCTDLFICPSHFMKERMTEGGFDERKLATLCNFIDTEKCRQEENYEREEYYCYVGRLSEEKGVGTLIAAACALPYRLTIIGDGPLKETLQAESRKRHAPIEFIGFRQWKEIKDIVGKARFCVIPSEWYENNPLSVIESLCLGTPVLGAHIGGIPELIEESVTGMTFTSGDADDLKEKLQKMVNTKFDYTPIAINAQRLYGAERYYEEIMKIYQNK